MKPGVVGVAVVAIALVVGGLFFGVGGFSDDGGSTASVPRATLPPSTVAPPAPAVVGTEPDSTAPVTTQADPTPTTVAAPEGNETLPVPNVIGVSQATAESRLGDFDVQVTTVAATDAEFLDEVSEQTPEAAARLPAGGTVSITVSVQSAPETIPVDPIPVGAATRVDFAALEDGDCGNGAAVDEILLYERVECDEFHDVQVIQRFDVEGAPDDFDELEIDDLIRDQCRQPYLDFVGVDVGDSNLFLRTIRPNPERYVSEGERTSLCLVVPPRLVRIQGSAEGSLW